MSLHPRIFHDIAWAEAQALVRQLPEAVADDVRAKLFADVVAALKRALVRYLERVEREQQVVRPIPGANSHEAR